MAGRPFEYGDISLRPRQPRLVSSTWALVLLPSGPARAVAAVTNR